MSLIQCSSDCLYQHEGYCKLEKAAEITSYAKADGCLHFVPSKLAPSNSYTNSSQNLKWYRNGGGLS